MALADVEGDLRCFGVSASVRPWAQSRPSKEIVILLRDEDRVSVAVSPKPVLLFLLTLRRRVKGGNGLYDGVIIDLGDGVDVIKCRRPNNEHLQPPFVKLFQTRGSNMLQPSILKFKDTLQHLTGGHSSVTNRQEAAHPRRKEYILSY